MAETHRRVEARGIVGTGMSADPERIRDIENRAARMERDHNLPTRKFGEVFDTAPKGQAPKDTEWVDAPPAKEKRSARGVPDPKGRAVDKDGKGDTDGKKPDEGETAGKGKEGPEAKEEPRKPQRPSMGAANAAVGSKLGARARVAFKV